MHVESRRHLPAKITSHPVFTANEERWAFFAIAVARVAAWQAVLSDRRLAPRCLPTSAAALPEHVVWDSAREAAVMRPTPATRASFEAAVAPLATALAAADRDDEALRHAAAEVGRLAVRASTPSAWVRRVGDAMRSLAVAINHVEEHNFRLVLDVARRQHKPGGFLTVADLFAHGCEGLRMAVLRYDPSRGFRFSTYATWWVKHGVRRAFQNLSREIRLPVHLLERAARVINASCADPSDENLAAAREVGEVFHMATPTSLYTEVGFRNGEDPMLLVNRVVDESSPDPDEALHDSERRDLLSSLLDTLDERSRFVVEAAYGLQGNSDEEMLKTIGDALGVTRERARQIKERALERLRDEAQREARGQALATTTSCAHVCGPASRGIQVSLSL